MTENRPAPGMSVGGMSSVPPSSTAFAVVASTSAVRIEALQWGGWYWNMLQPIYLNANQGKCQLLNALATDIVFDREECGLQDFFTFAKAAQQFAPPTMEVNFFSRNIGMWLQYGYSWEPNLESAADEPMVIGVDVGAAPVPVPNEGDTSFTTYGGRAMMILWGAYLIWIYVPDLPGGVAAVSMAAPFGMILVGMPQLRVSQIFWPAFNSTLCAGLIYIFILPKLTTFLELSLLLFATTFAICYLYAAPQKALGRAFGIAMFLVVTTISNDQVFSFMVVANTALMLPVVFSILLVASYIPYSPDPDKQFLRLLERYFRSSEYLLASVGTDSAAGRSRLEAWQFAYHRQEVATLPRKLGTWVRLIDPKLLPADQPGALAAVVAALEGLTYRTQEIINESRAEFPPAFVASLRADLRAWREGVRSTFDQLIDDPGAIDPRQFSAGLDTAANHMEEQVRATLDQPDRAGLSADQGAAFFRLLAAYRGVAAAVGNYARAASGIDWARWREERFA